MSQTSATRPPAGSSKGLAARHFIRHFLEMVLAMVVGMAVLGATVSTAFAALGHADLLHFAGLRAVLMTSYMVAGMSPLILMHVLMLPLMLFTMALRREEYARDHREGVHSPRHAVSHA